MQRRSVDKSIRADVNVIRHKFECRNVAKLTWNPGKTNLANAETKSNSPVSDLFCLTLAGGRLAVSLKMVSDYVSSGRSLG